MGASQHMEASHSHSFASSWAYLDNEQRCSCVLAQHCGVADERQERVEDLGLNLTVALGGTCDEGVSSKGRGVRMAFL